uniref:Putative inositol-phosphate phosphatase n=1 Tax=Magnetococcus massalia (strain MO-1) TaxID=451514 RepID=A0A1S7LPC5_MAGMO|nr:Putative inositol-phosphate phosphatase [Candidatus Magnetococcus massalia]
MNPDYATECALMQEAAKSCHDIIMRYFKHGKELGSEAGVRDKDVGNPLTEADLEVDKHLHKTLLGARPDYGWLSEETADNAERLKKERIWVVDPIDGTKEFIAGIPQFAISIGLVESGTVVAAVVYNPPEQELFSAYLGGGTLLNGEPIHTTERGELQGATCLASRSETKRGDWDDFKDLFELTTMGSIAYKLALVAAGRFDMTFTLTPKNEWDYCAGLLLVEEAGGKVCLKDGESFIFNRPHPKTRSVLATNGLLNPLLLERLQSVPLGPDRR